MQDSNIVFGGEQRLRQAIREAYELFQPYSISVFSTCPIGLIGDDIHAVCREMKAELGINVFGFSCEGYRGVSQSAGHHIANNKIFSDVVGLRTLPERKGKFQINMMGEYNIGGDAFVLEKYFEEVGATLMASFSGNSTIESYEYSQMVDLNMVMCHRSINYIAEMMEKKYGIPWFKVNFIGAEATAKSLRKMAEYFEDPEMIAKTEALIEREMAKVKAVVDEIRPKVEGKTAMLFVGGSRAHHYQELFKELGMKVLSAGYEFGHRDDYEGRRVIPSIKIDADSRNIEELNVSQSTTEFRPELQARKEALVAKGFGFEVYEGLMPDMEKNSLVIDDISHYETEKLIELMRPDIFCAGIKEKYVVQKKTCVALANCFVNFSTFKAKPLLYIHDFVVDPAFRNRGYGSQFMNAILQWSKQQGHCRVNLEVRNDNPNAQKLYTNAGFADCDPPMYFWEHIF